MRRWSFVVGRWPSHTFRADYGLTQKLKEDYLVTSEETGTSARRQHGQMPPRAHQHVQPAGREVQVGISKAHDSIIAVGRKKRQNRMAGHRRPQSNQIVQNHDLDSGKPMKTGIIRDQGICRTVDRSGCLQSIRSSEAVLRPQSSRGIRDLKRRSHPTQIRKGGQ
jgi:hypothetical protein